MVGMPVTRRRSSVLGSLYKDSFEEHKWRCIFSPDHARGTLKPFATLNVKVSYCRDLIGNKSTFGRLASSDPYYELYVDDKVVFASRPVHGTVNPNFKDGSIEIPLYHPLSIIRIQIMDEQRAWNKVFLNDDILGFVEFPVSDLPVATPVQGLCELRFRTMLLGQARERVKQHITHRDESLSALLPNDDALLTEGESLVPMNARIEFEDIDPMSTMALRKKKRRKGMLAACCVQLPDHSMGEDAYETDAHPYTEVQEECHLNGGECFIELFLMTTSSNEFFAVCLPRPTWTNFPPPIARRTDLPQVDLQQVIDTYVFVKEKVFDRSFLCAVDFIVYMLTWQNTYLSLFNLCMATIFCFMPERIFTIVLLNIGVYMTLLSSPKFRTVTTVNANTVPLNDLGYQQVASLNNPKSTFAYIRRVLKSMHGVILDEDKAEHFAALAVRDGLTALPNYAALEAELRAAVTEEDPWVEFAPNQITEDTSVVILPDSAEDHGQEEFGRVLRCNFDGTYIVFSELTRTNKLVEAQRIQKRMKAPYVPQWIIPTAVENQLRGLYATMSRLRDQLIPSLMAIRKIICWENWWTSFAITATCFAISFTLIVLSAFELAQEYVIHFIKVFVGLAMVFAVFVLPSWWFQRMLTICAACAYSMRHLTRYRYKKWAFFHEMTPGLYTNQTMKNSLTRYPYF